MTNFAAEWATRASCYARNRDPDTSEECFVKRQKAVATDEAKKGIERAQDAETRTSKRKRGNRELIREDLTN